MFFTTLSLTFYRIFHRLAICPFLYNSGICSICHERQNANAEKKTHTHTHKCLRNRSRWIENCTNQQLFFSFGFKKKLPVGIHNDTNHAPYFMHHFSRFRNSFSHFASLSLIIMESFRFFLSLSIFGHFWKFKPHVFIAFDWFSVASYYQCIVPFGLACFAWMRCRLSCRARQSQLIEVGDGSDLCTHRIVIESV